MKFFLGLMFLLAAGMMLFGVFLFIPPEWMLSTSFGKEWAIEAHAEGFVANAFKGHNYNETSSEIVWKGKKDNHLTYIHEIRFNALLEGVNLKNCWLSGYIYMLETEDTAATMKRVNFNDEDYNCKKEVNLTALSNKYGLGTNL